MKSQTLLFSIILTLQSLLFVGTAMGEELLVGVSSNSLDSVVLSESGILSWKSDHAHHSYRPDFVVQRWQGGYWAHVKRIPAQVKEVAGKYSVSVELFPGNNWLRVKAESVAGCKPTFTEVMVNKAAPALEVNSKRSLIQFNASTTYTIKDVRNGSTIEKGNGTSFDMATLRKGKYLLFYSNQVVDVDWDKKRHRLLLTNPRIDQPGFTFITPEIKQKRNAVSELDNEWIFFGMDLMITILGCW